MQRLPIKLLLLYIEISRKYFAEYGYYDVPLEKIPEEANVTRGAIYHHFKNKQGLFMAVLDNVQKSISVQIEREPLK